MLIAVKHNIEVAHRLFGVPGKCENIHGHSMWVTMRLEGEVDHHGMMEGLDYGPVKKTFRQFLDDQFDHRLLLHREDIFAQSLLTMDPDTLGVYLPGLNKMDVNPTTENIAMVIGSAMTSLKLPVHSVEVWETSVNQAEWFNPDRKYA